MKIVTTKAELRSEIGKARSLGKQIGFIPTMGFLHIGHASLFQLSIKRNLFTVVSIFVNPKQFNDPKDFENYPIDQERDIRICQEQDVDLLFLPSVNELYSDNEANISLQIPSLQANLCGKTRPGHFEGVMLVVSKLFHIVEPDIAFFGKKDYQQFRIIEEMVRALSFPIQIVGGETLREPSGLALSSRNAKLDEKELEAAELIPRMFALLQKVILSGEIRVDHLRSIASEFLLVSPLLRIDYLEFVDPISLQNITELKGSFLFAVAVFSGKVRLIDNREWKV